MNWKKFGNEPLSGVYWVRGIRPEYEVDCDDNGRTVGRLTGKVEEFIALVEILFDGEDLNAAPISRLECGIFDDDCGITHYAAVEIPVFNE